MYVNDFETKKSTPINAGNIPEIAGISADEFRERYGADIDKLNEDLTDFSFSTEPRYGYRYFRWHNEDQLLIMAVPRTEIEEWTTLDGFFYLNPDFDPEDSESSKFLEYSDEDCQLPVNRDVFDADGNPVDEFETIYEAVTYWDGSNWEKLILTSNFYDTEYYEIPDTEFDMESLELLQSREVQAGREKYYVDQENGRYYVQHVSYWQGSLPWDPFEEYLLREFQIELFMYFNLTSEEKALVGLGEFDRPEAAVVEYSDYGNKYELIDAKLIEWNDKQPDQSGTRGTKIGKLPDGRTVKLHWSQWQGENDEWVIE